jgi:hypothetical protein
MKRLLDPRHLLLAHFDLGAPTTVLAAGKALLTA